MNNIIVERVIRAVENWITLEFPVCPIQELPGHGSSRTTEKYTHFATKGIQNIRSPFDDL
jgi:hypothetical protein